MWGGAALGSLFSGSFGLLLGALLLGRAEAVDGDLCVGLAVTVLDPVALAALLLEDDDLVALDVVEDFGGHGGAVYHGRSNLDVAVS